MSPFHIAIAGNPNSGKTTIFNALTGARQRVGNWPGVTVERKEGTMDHFGDKFTVIDLPGTYSLASYSIEEKVARQFLFEEKPHVVVNVIDASNLNRNLYLTTQLIEAGTPLVIALNMMDMADEKGLKIDTKTLGTLLGAPVIPIVGRTKEGLEELKKAIHSVANQSAEIRDIHIPYPQEIEEEIETVSKTLNTLSADADRPRWKTTRLLSRDETTTKKLQQIDGGESLLESIERSIKRIESIYGDSISAVITHARYGFIQGAIRECVTETITTPRDYSREIDKLLTNRWLGLPVFAMMMWLMFKLTYDIGGYPMDWIDSGVVWLMEFFSGILPQSMFASLLVDGVIGGVGSIAVFLPNIFILFFIIAIFEDSGYMARVAFIMDRIMHTIGLHGKAFIPMIMGFGCNVPAIMGTRILETKRDRILTILLNPFMSCSARFPVYVLVTGAFFPQYAATVIFGLYAFGIVAAIASGKLLSKTVLKGFSKPFVMELPPYQRPTLRSILLHTWERGFVFIQKMGTVILVGSIIIWALGYFPREVELDRDYTLEKEKIFIKFTERSDQINLLFEHSIDKGKRQHFSEMVPFKESAKYSVLIEQRDSLLTNLKLEQETELVEIRYEEMAETMENKWIGKIGKFIEPTIAPLGFSWREGIALVTGFVAKEVVVSTYGVLFGVGEGVEEKNSGVINRLRQSGMSPLIAFGFLIFTLLYTPCLATVAAIKRETSSWMYAILSVVYSFSLAWLLAFIIFQTGSLL